MKNYWKPKITLNVEFLKIAIALLRGEVVPSFRRGTVISEMEEVDTNQ